MIRRAVRIILGDPDLIGLTVCFVASVAVLVAILIDLNRDRPGTALMLLIGQSLLLYCAFGFYNASARRHPNNRSTKGRS